MSKPAAVLTIVLGVAAATACLNNSSRVIAPGSWGGTHLSMEVTATGARLEYDCAAGTVEEVIRPDSEGRFTATGLHTPGHGGPIRVGEIPQTFRARYEGLIDGDQMSLRVTLTDTGVELGPFQLRRGSTGQLFRCL